jgi:hypothetical protein
VDADASMSRRTAMEDPAEEEAAAEEQELLLGCI